MEKKTISTSPLHKAMKISRNFVVQERMNVQLAYGTVFSVPLKYIIIEKKGYNSKKNLTNSLHIYSNI